MPFARLCLLLSLTLCSPIASAQQTWVYDMLLSRKVIGEQTLRLLPNAVGSMLIQSTNVEKKGWFSSFEMHSISVEQLDSDSRSLGMQTRVTANGRTWWSELFSSEDGQRGAGRDMGILNGQRTQQLQALDKKILAKTPPSLEQLRTLTEDIFADAPQEQQATLDADTKFVTTLNALPFYLKQVGRVPGALQLLDNEGLQVINSPITDLGTQQMEIGGARYTARHIKIEKADAGTHIWYNEGDTGPVVLMIAGRSGKKNFQISLKEKQRADH